MSKKYGAVHENLGSCYGKLKCLPIADLLEALRSWYEVRVNCEETIHISVDFAIFRTQLSCESNRREIAAAAAERSDMIGSFSDSLEAGHYHHLALVEKMHHALDAVDLLNPRTAMPRIGLQAELESQERFGLRAILADNLVDCERE